jgi:hypothetical protein
VSLWLLPLALIFAPWLWRLWLKRPGAPERLVVEYRPLYEEGRELASVWSSGHGFNDAAVKARGFTLDPDGRVGRGRGYIGATRHLTVFHSWDVAKEYFEKRLGWGGAPYAIGTNTYLWRVSARDDAIAKEMVFSGKALLILDAGRTAIEPVHEPFNEAQLA